MPQLTDIDRVRAYIGPIKDDKVPFLVECINAAEDDIFGYCGRKVGVDTQHGFVTGSKVQYFEGRWSDRVCLTYTPITAVASVATVTSATDAGVETTNSIGLGNLSVDGYPLGGAAFHALDGILAYRNSRGASHWGFELGLDLERGSVFDKGATLGGGFRRLKVTYTGGYVATAIPAGLAWAARMYAAHLFRARRQIPVTVGDQSNQRSEPETSGMMPSQVRAMLGPFRRRFS